MRNWVYLPTFDNVSRTVHCHCVFACVAKVFAQTTVSDLHESLSLFTSSPSCHAAEALSMPMGQQLHVKYEEKIRMRFGERVV